jgi:uncharacterized protein YutE (UPF0331/DUF86 family)
MSPRDAEPRRVDVRRWRQEIVDLIADLPRQHEALEYAMRAFGEDFELPALKRALDRTADIEAYSRAQALERAVTRVQNMLAELAIAGAKLGGLEPPDGSRGGRADRSFDALREASVIDASAASRLKDSQRIRNLIEHDYEKVSAGRLHRAAKNVSDLTFEFLRPFRTWVEPYLDD